MENLKQMTLEQLSALQLEQLSALQKEKTQRYTELNEQVTDVKYDLFKINPILAQKMSHRSPLIGKKVEVVAQRFLRPEEKHTIIGFFGGYSTSNENLSIRPIIYKIKKDGTSSKNTYSEFDIPSIEHIISIGEVTE